MAAKEHEDRKEFYTLDFRLWTLASACAHLRHFQSGGSRQQGAALSSSSRRDWRQIGVESDGGGG
jgi:hypothetical protein